MVASMTAHRTAGPWYYVSGAVWNTPNGPDDNGACVALRDSGSIIPPWQRDLNLRAIAELPALIDAARNMLAAFDTTCAAGKRGIGPAQAIKQRDATRAVLARIDAYGDAP